MKNIYVTPVIIVILIMSAFTGYSQSPEGFTFQAEARDNRGRILSNAMLDIKATIIKGSPTSDADVWDENYQVKTDKYGLFTMIIGDLDDDEILDDGPFSAINWADGPYFLKVQILYNDVWTTMPVTQLLSVPYALHAKTADAVNGTVIETDPVFKESPAFNIFNTDIGHWNDAYGWGDHSTEGYLKSFTEVDPLFSGSPAKNLTDSDINNWNSAFGWGDHKGLYRPLGYVPSWDEITSNPFSITSPENNQLLRYNSTTKVWENWTPDFMTGFTETDPVFGSWNKSDGISITSSQVSDFNNAVENNTAVLANTAKNSYPAEDKTKLEGIESGAEVNVNADWNATDGDAQILNKPTLSAVASSGSYSDLLNKPDLTVYATKNMASQNLTNLANPVNAQDAATKSYVDAIVNQLYEQGILKLKDADGNIYNTIKIGNQIWMAENLKTTKYSDGNAIPLATDRATWNGFTGGGYCWYNYDESTYKNTYGALYNWNAVITGKLCPEGWHVPGDDEWTILTDFLGGITVAGGKMKETGTTHWQSPNADATNESGFTALPCGYVSNGYFNNIGYFAHLWTSTEIPATNAWKRYLSFNDSNVYRESALKVNGYGVRCVKD